MSGKSYAVSKGKLQPFARDFPQVSANKRPVLESGEASKIVYLSKAPPSYTHEDLAKALSRHVSAMRRELAFHGKFVTKVTKILWGEGDMKVICKWCVYGTKNTKRARLATNARNARDSEAGKPGPSVVQEDPKPV